MKPIKNVWDLIRLETLHLPVLTPQLQARCTHDDSLAEALQRGGLRQFVKSWYSGSLWDTLRAFPGFQDLLEQRCMGENKSMNNDAATITQLAAALSGMSSGRQEPMWDLMKHAKPTQVLIVVGQLDRKFVGVANKMAASSAHALEVCVVNECLHYRFIMHKDVH